MPSITRGSAPAIEFRREALPQVQVLQAEWKALEALAQPSFFISWHWIGTLLAALPRACSLSLLRGSIRGETVALALLGARLIRRRGFLRSRALFLNEDGHPARDMAIEHNGVLVATNCEKVLNPALIEWFANTENADELCIGGANKPLESKLINSYGLTINSVTKPSYSIDLSRLSDTDGKLDAVLSGNARQQLRRSIRYFEKLGRLRLEKARNVDEAQAFFTDLKELHCTSWGNRGVRHSFMRPFFEVFHRLLIERNFPDGCIELVRVSAGSHVLGYLYNFRFGDRICAYQSGFAYDLGDRPGVVSHALAIQDSYRSGAHIYDFLAGRNRLKESFSTECDAMHWETIQQPRLAFRLENLARQVRYRWAGSSSRSEARSEVCTVSKVTAGHRVPGV